jgi:choline dehydrogenase-like flavoprotein
LKYADREQIVFVDARNLPSGTVIAADLCIIGGGAAGIAIAREFVGRGCRVCILESGGTAFSEETQALARGECVGLPYELDTTRARYFGGSTNWWAGFCRPFEEYHFVRRPWVPHSGWPITRRDLDPFYRRSFDLCGIDAGAFAGQEQPAVAGNPKLTLAETSTGRFVSTVTPLGDERLRFGKVFGDELMQANNVCVYLHANAVHLDSSEDARRVTGVRAATLAGNSFSVTGKVFILATGAIENARLLLLSNDRMTAGLGNQFDLVGRFFMEHATFNVGNLNLNGAHGPSPLYDSKYAVLNLPIAVELNPTLRTQREHRVLETALYFNAVFRCEDSAGVDALKKVRENMWRRTTSSIPARELRAIAADGFKVACFILGWMSRSRFLLKSHAVNLHLEQAPNPDSRVLLSHRRDRLGLPLVRLDWRLTDLDRQTVRTTARLLAEEAERSSWGPFASALPNGSGEPFPSPDWIWHHIGTTRMHHDPRQGVVDENCRVHGIGNLFVAGSSVFPTAGNHCPTLTLLALGLRLADHLKAAFDEGRLPEADAEPSPPERRRLAAQ